MWGFQIFLLFCILCYAYAHGIFYKNLQGPPSEFPANVLPDPMKTAEISRSCMVSGRLAQSDEDGYVSETRVPVHAYSSLQITLLTHSVPFSDLSVTFVNEDTQMEFLPVSVEKSYLGFNQFASVPSWTFTFESTEKLSGTWKIVLRTEKEPQLFYDRFSKGGQLPDLHFVLVISGDSPYNTFSYFDTFHFELGSEVGFHVYGYDQKAYDQTNSGKPAVFNNLQFAEVNMDTIFPDGNERVIPMHQTDENKLANNHIYSAQVPTTEPGSYIIQVTFKGALPDGQLFYRTAQHAITIVEPKITSLKPVGYMKQDQEYDDMVMIQLPVTSKLSLREKRFIAYGQAWGYEKDGVTEIPIAWASGMSIVEECWSGSGEFCLNLRISKEWFSRSNAHAPYSFQNVTLSDVDTNVPISQRLKMQLLNGLNDLEKYPHDGVIHERMTFGPKPDFLVKRAQTNNPNRALALIHGYCATGKDTWTREHFTGTVIALDDPGKNRNNDEFAQVVLQFIENHPQGPFDSVSAVTHSQGSLAVTTLLTYYWSPMDNSDAKNGRIVQSIGAPYQGTSLMNSVSWLAKQVGVGCGWQPGISNAGAALWLSHIPVSVRQKIWYSTTIYKDYYCSIIASIVIMSKNDGACEEQRGIMPDGNEAFWEVPGYCHATELRFPPQTQSKDLNEKFNQYASR